MKFRSDDPRSIIRAGSGYWKYVPTTEGIRFLTLYDYETRFGALGRSIDRLAFRIQPVSLNFAVACLAVIDLIALRALPSAARCRRRQAADE